MHSFIVLLDDDDFEGAIAKTFKNGCFVLGYKHQITFFNKKKEIRFSIQIDQISDELEIVSMSLSNNENRLAVAVGKVVQGIDE